MCFVGMVLRVGVFLGVLGSPYLVVLALLIFVVLDIDLSLVEFALQGWNFVVLVLVLIMLVFVGLLLVLIVLMLVVE